MKKLLYIGHAYHEKTKSTNFLQEILAQKYEIETFSFDPSCNNIQTHFDCLSGKKYDVLVLFQIMPDIDQLKKIIQFKHAVFFTMYDGSGGLPDSFWQQYKDFNIINFSKTLHNHLLHLGFSSYYIQYFPKLVEYTNHGNTQSIFFWQRVSRINLGTIEKILQNYPIKSVHVHKVLDPCESFVEPSAKLQNKITYSTWYETKKNMLSDVETCAIYFAPRDYEGIGMSFLEAMAMGRCVIAPNNPTMNEYIVHGQTGLLYDLYNQKPLDLFDIRMIQEKTSTYMQAGYKKWEKEKTKILDWIESPVEINTKLMSTIFIEKNNSKTIVKKISVIPITITEMETRKIWSVCKIFQILRRPKNINTKLFYLFGFLPLVMKEQQTNGISKRWYLLFAFLPLAKIIQVHGIKSLYLFGVIKVKK